jgi:hypothetical protein
MLGSVRYFRVQQFALVVTTRRFTARAILDDDGRATVASLEQVDARLMDASSVFTL